MRFAMENSDLDMLSRGQLDSEKIRCERRRTVLAERLPRGFAAVEQHREALAEIERLSLRITKIDQLLARKG